MVVPTMSAGIRSGVNWMRLKRSDSTSPSVRTSSVLPRPGTPSSRMWPPGEERQQHLVHGLVLTDDDLAQLVFDLPRPRHEVGDSRAIDLGVLERQVGHYWPSSSFWKYCFTRSLTAGETSGRST